MTRKIIAKIDTAQGWNVISLVSGIAAAGCFVLYLILAPY